LLNGQEIQCEALGGDLKVIARFPDGAVKISNFAELGRSAKD